MGKLLVFFATLFFLSYSFSQKNEAKAEKFADKAVVQMQKDNPKKASRLLEKAIKFNNSYIAYHYRLAYAYHTDGQFENSIETLNYIIDKSEDNEMVYELLGENYIELDSTDEAFGSYVKGIKKFPEEGGLYELIGRLEMSKESYLIALEHFENGILMAPNYPGNYYWASKIYCKSTEEIWGLIYGEIFINLERNSSKTEEISALIYNTLKNEITITKDSIVNVSLCQDKNRVFEENDTLIKQSFGKRMVELNIIKSLVDVDVISLRSIDKMRENFVAHYFKNPSEEYATHQLFEFHQSLVKHGHFEAYNYWLFMMGDLETFKQWEEANKSQWVRFLKWFKENSLYIEDARRIHRINFQ
jgi:tetratricopeptide (TPR) repeat protein